MPFIDESQLDPETPSSGGGRGRIISESELDPDRSGWGDYINDLSGQALKGVVPGGSYLDAASHSAQEGLLNLLGFEGHQGFGDAYRSRLNEVGQNNAAFEKNNPGTSFAAQLAGGVVSPVNALMPGMGGMSLAGKLGTGAAIGAGYGAAYGAGNEQVPMEDKVGAAGKGALFGSLFSPAVTLAGAALGKVAEKAPGIARSIDRKSIGARQGDYAKTANDVSLVSLPSGQIESLTKNAIDDLLTTGKLGTTRDPVQMIKAADFESSNLAQEIGQKIANYDLSGGPPIFPTFQRARQYLNAGKAPAHELPRYRKILDDLQQSIRDEGKGSLRYLQQQKIALEDKWDPTDKVASKFWRSVYSEIQGHIENAVPEVRGLNQELRKYILVKPILQRGLARDETSEGLGSLWQLMRTSGGVGVPFLAGVAAGMPGAGLAAAGTLAAAKTPRGMAAMSDAVEAIGGVAGRASSAQLSPRLSGQLGSFFAQGNSVFKPESASVFGEKPKAPKTPEVVQVSRGKEDTDVIPPADQQSFDLLLDAIEHVESRGNAKAVSSVGAKGAYQLMDETGKEYHRKLKLNDPYDPFDKAQAREIAQAIIKDYLRMFDGDIEKAVLAYHTGPGNVKKGKIGPEGRKYVPLIEAALRRIADQKTPKTTA